VRCAVAGLIFLTIDGLITSLSLATLEAVGLIKLDPFSKRRVGAGEWPKVAIKTKTK